MKRIVLTFALGSGCLCNAQPYVVSPSGNDANPGTLEKPFATLQRTMILLAKVPSSATAVTRRPECNRDEVISGS